MTGIVALYIFMLAAFTGYEVIAKVPVILHTPLMSGSNFVHGIVLVATIFTLLYPGMGNYPLILGAIVVGASFAWVSGKRVAMTNMPQMIALYNGMGGGAAAAIAAVELYRGESLAPVVATLAVVGGIIGAVSFSGSLIAFGKLQGLIKKSYRFGGQQVLNLLILAGALAVGALVACGHAIGAGHVTGIFGLALLLGVTMTLPIVGG